MENKDSFKNMQRDLLIKFLYDKIIKLIIIDPNQNSGLEDLIDFPYQIIDLNEVRYGELERWVSVISSDKSSSILFKNIDKIPEDSMKDYWESIVIIGLKGEEYPIQIETEDGYFKEFILPFDKIKLICTCSQYPDFLKDKGMLGYVFDFSNHDSDD